MKVKNVHLLFEVAKNENGDYYYLVRHPQSGQMLYFDTPTKFDEFVNSLFDEVDKTANKAAL